MGRRQEKGGRVGKPPKKDRMVGGKKTGRSTKTSRGGSRTNSGVCQGIIKSKEQLGLWRNQKKRKNRGRIGKRKGEVSKQAEWQGKKQIGRETSEEQNAFLKKSREGPGPQAGKSIARTWWGQPPIHEVKKNRTEKIGVTRQKGPTP